MSSGGYILAFAGGLAIGAGGAVLGTKNFYEKKCRKEVADMRAYYAKRGTETDKPAPNPEEGKQAECLYRPEDAPQCLAGFSTEDSSEVRQAQRTYTTAASSYDPSGTMSSNGPYAITEDQFGEWDDYEQITLYYWANRILTDDRNEPVTDIFELLGTLEPSQFDESDAVYIRNDKLGTDYEILRKLDDYPLYRPGDCV